MTSLALPSSVLAPSWYELWRRHFLQNRGGMPTLPWAEPQRLTAAERRLVARSIQQFQLGEFARGRGFMRRASAHPILGSDPQWLPALQLFIAEEQEHSNILGRYLDREGIPRLEGHWLDGMFRRLRKLAGLELCAAVLVTAETLAIPFYQALRDATHSPLLRAICVRILCDEAAHLKFQALTLGLIRHPLGKRARAIRSLGHAVLFHGTALLLWQEHRRVFRAAGWSFHRFWNEARREFEMLERQIGQVSAEGARFGSYDRQILD
ncbi:MAG TPA: ferritin-like domain-containing protein [Bryobacteraceae bacterium]|nr:ferritin-like domain-containing protein [Bryobacteraceae bacterium]